MKFGGGGSSGVGAMVSAAAAYSVSQTSMKPKVFRSSVDSTRIVHRELISTISAAGSSFAVLGTFNINPGLAASFPWLSSQAVGWEKYRFNKIRFCTYPFCPTTTAGSLMLAPDYDVLDAAPTSEFIASTYYGAVEDVPWTAICMELDPQRLKNPLFLRSNAGIPSGSDLRLYDVANVYAIGNNGAAAGWAKLWVEYDVELINPQMPSSGLPGVATVFANVGNLSATLLFGTGAVNSASGTLSASGGTTGTILTIRPAGSFTNNELVVTVAVTGTGITALTGSVGANAAITNSWVSCVNAAATSGVAVFTITTNANGGPIVLTLACTATTVTQTVVVTGTMPSGAIGEF